MFGTTCTSQQYLDSIIEETRNEKLGADHAYNLGKLVHHQLKKYPDTINQIDGTTDQWETNASVLCRSVALALALRSRGVGIGDAVALVSRKNLDVVIPVLAAHYLGAPVAPKGSDSKKADLKFMVDLINPKVIFCDEDVYQAIEEVLEEVGTVLEVIIIGPGNRVSDKRAVKLKDFIAPYIESSYVEEFRPVELDGSHSEALVLGTSGTTGAPKYTSLTHKVVILQMVNTWTILDKFQESPFLTLSPIQWISAIKEFSYGCIIVKTRLMISGDVLDVKQTHRIINKYRPFWSATVSTILHQLMPDDSCADCDFTCFEHIIAAGCAVSKGFLEKCQRLTKSRICNGYGMTELGGSCFTPFSNSSLESYGRIIPHLEAKLVDVKTGEDIITAGKPGELWVKGSALFKEYYKDIKATQEAYTDGWFRTGDMFTRDAAGDYSFYERAKLLLESWETPNSLVNISPTEIEGVIGSHPGVKMVGVAGIPLPHGGDLVGAVVVKQPGSGVTATIIKALVEAHLNSDNHLRAGVAFVDGLPLTGSGKIDRMALKKLLASAAREQAVEIPEIK